MISREAETHRPLPKTEAKSHNDLPSGKGTGEVVEWATRVLIDSHSTWAPDDPFSLESLTVRLHRHMARALSAAGLLAPSPDLAAMRKALEPFARMAEACLDTDPDGLVISLRPHGPAAVITAGDCRRAREALANNPNESKP